MSERYLFASETSCFRRRPDSHVTRAPTLRFVFYLEPKRRNFAALFVTVTRFVCFCFASLVWSIHQEGSSMDNWEEEGTLESSNPQELFNSVEVKRCITAKALVAKLGFTF